MTCAPTRARERARRAQVTVSCCPLLVAPLAGDFGCMYGTYALRGNPDVLQ
jgi:hypothetical protein